MIASGKKRHAFIFLVLLLLAAGAGVLLLEYNREKEILRYISEIPGSLKAEKVSVSLLRGSVTITGLSGRVAVFAHDPLDLSAERLVLEGLNRNASDSVGETRLVKAVRAKNMRLEAPDNSRLLMGYSSMSLGDVSVDGLSAEYRALARAAASRNLGDDFIKAALSLRFGPWSSSDITCIFRGLAGMEALLAVFPDIPPQGFALTVKHGQGEAYTLTDMGKMRVADVSMSMAGGSAMQAKAMSMDSMAVSPALLRAAFLGIGELVHNPAAGLKMLADGYACRNLTATELLFTLPEAGTVRIPEGFMSLEIGGGSLDMKTRADAILITPEALLAWFPDWKPTLEALGAGPLHFFLDCSLESKKEAAGTTAVSFDWKSGEKRLGDLIFAFTLNGRALDGPGSLLPLDIATAALSGAAFEIRDRDFLHVAFLSPAWSGIPEGGIPAGTPEEAAQALRAYVVKELENGSKGLPEPYRRVLEAYARWVAGSGTLAVTAKPEKPLYLMNMVLYGRDVSGELRLNATHIPPETRP